MPIYEEKEKVNGQKRYFIRTYVTTENGTRKQITKHNKEWIGRDGYWLAQQEENRIRNVSLYKIEKISLKKLTSEFLNHKKPMVKLSTYLKYRDDINRYILPYFNHETIDKITTNKILLWQDKINSLNFSICTKKKVFSLFSSVMKYGCTFYGFEKNVITLVGNFRAPKGESIKKMNFLTVNEFNDFISFERNPLYKRFFTILFFTGMRRGELLALTKKDINFTDATITINKTYSPRYKRYGIEETVPKTNKSNRKLKMTNVVMNTFKEMILPENGKIFNDITLTTLKTKCDNNCKNANITKKIRIHDFRHSFASMCIENDIQIGLISEYLGHENISITLDTYSHLYPNSQDKLVNKINSIQ